MNAEEKEPSGDLDGNPYPAQVRDAFRVIRALTDDERGMVMCWFCRYCWRYVGPGDACHCWNDE